MVAEETIVEKVPIAKDQDGVIRVSGSRVQLETIILAFQDGATAESIAQSYSTVPLADVYQVIAYYLRHKAPVDEYVRKRLAEAEEMRKNIEARWPQEGVRERLLARQRAKQGE